jgi:tryptophan synthase alpha chain
MCYANLVLSRGWESFAKDLREAGGCGLICPDLPLEEAQIALEALDSEGLALVPLVAPTTPDARLGLIGAQARGFLYTVSVTGTTGERGGDGPDVASVIARAKGATDVPVAVGFGISTPEQAAAVSEAGADGIIVGSRLVRAAAEEQDPANAVGALVRELAGALR